MHSSSLACVQLVNPGRMRKKNLHHFIESNKSLSFGRYKEGDWKRTIKKIRIFVIWLIQIYLFFLRIFDIIGLVNIFIKESSKKKDLCIRPKFVQFLIDAGISGGVTVILSSICQIKDTYWVKLNVHKNIVRFRCINNTSTI